MDVLEALYTTRVMRRMKPDPVTREVRMSILDAMIRAPNGGNAQRWHFVVVDDDGVKERLRQVYVGARESQYADFNAGKLGSGLDESDHDRALRLARLKASGDYFVEHFCDTPFFVLFFSLGDRDGGNLWPAVWSSMLAARRFGVGCVLSTLLRYEHDAACHVVGAPVEEGWSLTACVGYGYPIGNWGVARRKPVHEVASLNEWCRPLDFEAPEPLWSPSAPGTSMRTKEDVRR